MAKFVVLLDVTVIINISQEILKNFAQENVKSDKFEFIPQRCIREN